MEIYLYALISTLVVSAISLVGVFTISLNERVLRKYLFLLISLAAGALIGDAFLHLIPEAFEVSSPEYVALAVMAGIMLFFVLEKVLHWHHHGEDTHNHDVHPTGRMMLVSDGVHNLIDGIVIGASYFVSIEAGIATTIAVMLHEIPQEFGDFGVLIHAGYTRARALWFNFLSALTAVVGVGLVFILGATAESFLATLVPLAAGGFIYIALSDLVPEMHKTRHLPHSILQILAIVAGIAAMVALLALE